MPPRLLRRNDLGISVWTNVLLDKYLNARASNRLLQEFQSYGLDFIIFLCDRFSSYKKMAKDMAIFILAFCWAHVRRDLWDASKPLQQQSEAFMEQHHALECSVKKMEQQRDDYLAQADLAAPRRSVLASLKNHWKGLTVFLDHPEVRMDNSISEQAARKGAIGRNNYYGSGSVWSGELAAMMFTLMQTLQQWGINQHHCPKA